MRHEQEAVVLAQSGRDGRDVTHRRGASSSINFDIRTPSSTVGSYSNVSVGVRFIAHLAGDAGLEDAVRGVEALERTLALALGAEHAHVDDRVAQVRQTFGRR